MAEPIANTETDVRLDYAPLDAARRRRRLRRVLCAVGLVALIVAGAWLGPALWRGARVMYAVRYALGYDAALGDRRLPRRPDYQRPLVEVGRLAAGPGQERLRGRGGGGQPLAAEPVPRHEVRATK